MKTNLKIMHVLAAIALTTAAFSAQATPQTGYFIYDESGHLIGEYDANGNTVQEHIYLGDRPVAVVQGQTGSVGYVTVDQLNTPRAVTDQNATLEWSWTSDPFGNGQPTGSLTYNLRFPGQYYDAETGHDYNYQRDYDPGTGRYMESDPKGVGAHVRVMLGSLSALELTSQQREYAVKGFIRTGGGFHTLEGPTQSLPLELNSYLYVNANSLMWVDPEGLQTLALPIPWSIPWAVPAALPAAIAAGIGALFYSPDAGCENEDKCVEEWRAAYETCAREMKLGGGRGVTGNYKDEYACARGLVSEKCGGNRVDHGDSNE